MDTGEAVDPQWDDERIAFRAHNTPTDRKAQYVISLLKQMRDDLHATIATQAAKITELELERVTLWHTVNTQAEYIDAELQAAQAAGEWRPVSDGALYIEGDDNYLTASLGGSLLSIIRSDLDEPDMDEECYKHAIQLDPNKYRLCQRTTIGSQEGQNE